MPGNRKSNRNGKLEVPPSASSSPKRRKSVFILAALAVLGLGAYFSFASESEPQYLPEDVVRAKSFIAVHEMRAGPKPRFLPETEAQPHIEIPEDSYSFGRIGAKDIVTRTFVIRNTGEAPLTISRAYTTCGCTRAKITAKVIPPGKVALATVKFDAGFHDTRGQSVKRGLIIESNDRDEPKAAIWVQASVAKF